MVECRFYTADTAVQFCHEVPNNTCRRFDPVTRYHSREAVCLKQKKHWTEHTAMSQKKLQAITSGIGSQHVVLGTTT